MLWKCSNFICVIHRPEMWKSAKYTAAKTMIIDVCRAAFCYSTFSVFLLHYACFVIVITVLVTTSFLCHFFCAVDGPSSKWVTDRKKFLVCRQESKSVCECECDYLFELTISCNTHMYNVSSFAMFACECECHQPVFDNYRSIYSMQQRTKTQCNWHGNIHIHSDSQTKADSGTFTSNHLFLLHSFDFDGLF